MQINRNLSKEELLNLVKKIYVGDYETEEKRSELLNLFRENITHPEPINLIFHHEPELTPEEIVEKALSYKPVILPNNIDKRSGEDRDVTSLVQQARDFGFLNKISIEDIEFVEKELGLKFDRQFREIVAGCSYESFSKFNFYGFADKGKDGVVASTLTLRKHWNLPSDYITLAANGSKLVLMSIINENMSQALWCELEDMKNICSGREMTHEPKVFSSFLDFYKFLVEEEKLRAEE